MDLLIEKLDGSRYYLSQYKVLITDFEESAPSVTRNSMKLDQRNGNIDFGGWHTDKTINVTGYYRADDMDEEEALREKLYALLSDPDGYYITQLKTSPETVVERPGETSGGYYDKLKDYPSHKRFLVYTEAPELELVGNVNGTLLYKMTAEFKTMKLPYGETPAVDIAIDSPYKDVPVNLLMSSEFDRYWSIPSQATIVDGYDGHKAIHVDATGLTSGIVDVQQPIYNADVQLIKSGEWHTTSFYAKGTGFIRTYMYPSIVDTSAGAYVDGVFSESATSDGAGVWPLTDEYVRHSWTFKARTALSPTTNKGNMMFRTTAGNSTYTSLPKLEQGTTASPWSPNQADPEYNSWRYGLTGNVSVPYSGTVPCNQLEQQFAIELTARGASSSLSFKIDDTEFTYSGDVASGDVFLFTGFSYTKNGLSIVSKTNKAYFILQPDKPNRITCNIPGTVRILGFKNLYA